MKRWKNVTAGCTSAATAIAVNAHAMTALRVERDLEHEHRDARSRRGSRARTGAKRALPDAELPDAPCAAWSARRPTSTRTITTWPTRLPDPRRHRASRRTRRRNRRDELDRDRHRSALGDPLRDRVRDTRGDRLVRAFRPAHADRPRGRHAARARAQSARGGAAAPHVMAASVRGRRSCSSLFALLFGLGVALVTVPTIQQVATLN